MNAFPQRRPTRAGLLAALLVVVGLAAQAQGTTYYLAANGDDNNSPDQAQNPATPWRSIAKLNGQMSRLQAGDHVLFRRGDTFRGQLAITRSGSSGSPLTFGAYGAAADPVPTLNGSAPLSGWTSAGTNLWQVSCPSAGETVTGVYANGQALPLGRYPNLDAPNKGYLPITSHSGNGQLTSASLGGNWTGATAVVRNERWILDRIPVTGQSGSTLTLGTPENQTTVYPIKDNWGFFLQNHPATLDQPGEWYYDAANHKLLLYATAQPADGTVEATTADPAGIVVRQQQYLTLENLALVHTRNFGLDAQDVSNFTVRGVSVLGSGENAVRLSGGGSDVLFESNLIQDSNNNGVNVSSYSNFTFRNNTLRNTGLIPGRGRGGDGQYFTLQIEGSNAVLVDGNTLDRCGYVGISYNTTNNITIQNNLVSNYSLTKDDSGGIYTWNGFSPPKNLVNAQILNNIVLNSGSAPEGTDSPTYIPGHGIYLDDCSQNVTIRGNTTANCPSSGIFIHNSSHVTIEGNTSYNNGVQLLLQYNQTSACPITALTVKDNVLVSADASQEVLRLETTANDLATFGTFDNNYYVSPFADDLKIGYAYMVNGNRVSGRYSLADWQAAYGQDAHSHNSPVRFRSFRVSSLLGSSLLPNGTFDANLNGWSNYTPTNDGIIDWDNSGQLGSGGSLRLSFPGATQAGAKMLTESGIGSVVQGHSYVVRFQARCSAGTKALEVYLKQGGSPYRDVVPARQAVALGTAAQTYELAFTPNVDDANVRLAFEVAEDNRPVWLDNISVQEARLTPASVADSIRFEYNATANARTVTLPGGISYVDARSTAYSGSLTLAPYASVVLLRTAGTTPAPPAATADLVSGGVYKLLARHSGQALDVSGNSGANGASIVQWPWSGGANQQWVVELQSDGTYTLTHQGTSERLDVKDNSAADGSAVQQWAANTSDAQRWSILPTDNGYYKLIHKGTTKCLDVDGSPGATAKGTKVHQWEYAGGLNQQWQLVRLDNAAATAKTASVSPAAASSAAPLVSDVAAPLSVYPNPSHGQATLSFTAARAQRATVYVHDAQANLVTLLTVPVQAGHTDFALPGSLPQGIYFVRTTLDGRKQHFTLKVE